MFWLKIGNHYKVNSYVSDVVFSIVGYPKDVQEIFYGSLSGQKGILEGLMQGSKRSMAPIYVDMTTSEPQLAQKIHQNAKEKGIEALDAPVSGGDVGAKNATLSVHTTSHS
jgi:3-hydroxyisobutyrate dehydrogenase